MEATEGRAFPYEVRTMDRLLCFSFGFLGFVVFELLLFFFVFFFLAFLHFPFLLGFCFVLEKKTYERYYWGP